MKADLMFLKNYSQGYIENRLRWEAKQEEEKLGGHWNNAGEREIVVQASVAAVDMDSSTY